MTFRNLLSINFNHDGAAALLVDGALAGYVNTERFSRKRRHPGIRECDLDELLDQASLRLADVDLVLLCNLDTIDSPEIPAQYGSDLKETWFEFTLAPDLHTVSIRGRQFRCEVNPPHHELHAALAFFTSPYDSAMVLSTDPTGWEVFAGIGTDLRRLPRPALNYQAPNLYADVAFELFGSALSGAGKVMGLAPYGRDDAPAGVDFGAVRDLGALRGAAAGRPVLIGDENASWNARLAWLIQQVLDAQLTALAGILREQCAAAGVAARLCLGGGTALNSVSNQIAFERSGFDDLYLHPACGDDGTAIGAALWYWHARLGHRRRAWSHAERMYSVRRYDAGHATTHERYRDRIRLEPCAAYVQRAADLIAEGAIVGWFQGASEIGPRALGNRSLLADPRLATLPARLNERVKFREAFRPFAPAVLREAAGEWFSISDSPFMLRVAAVCSRAVPAVRHVDGTARLQTVAADDNPAFHELLTRFAARTGLPVLLNTSFNTCGEPIVETPEHALETFLACDIDVLAFPGLLVHKRLATH